ncbi:MAG: asparagine synthetase B [Proteobacteria bacterium]|nr:asparagine synthetase B [Pseudomonadota bacterium]
MSALCGFLNLDSAPADPALVSAQLARLKHLGPDGSGTFTSGPVALRHALLSITPESEAEASPWRSSDGQRVIAFDGRLDHREDLCAALGLPPAERGLPDPELILRAYEKWGAVCAARLEGEFAFALWDMRKRELFCATDAFAQRPFFFHCSPKRFAFASMIRGVLAVPEVPRALDELTLACMLGGVPHPDDGTLYKDIFRLTGGRTLTIRSGGGPEIRSYWQPSMGEEIQLRRPEDYAETLREMLERSVRSALRTRHPVAAMLSGGLDSTGVACLAARELAAQGQQITTVSSILPDNFKGDEWAHEERDFIRSTLACYPNMEAQYAYGLEFPVVTLDDSYYQLQDLPDNNLKSFRVRELDQRAEQRGARIVLGGGGGDMAASFKGTGHLQQLVRAGRWLEAIRRARRQAQKCRRTMGGIFRSEVLRPLAPQWMQRLNEKIRHGRSRPEQITAIHPDFTARLRVDELQCAAGMDQALPADFRRLYLNKFVHARFEASTTHFNPHLEHPQPLMDRRIWDWCYRVPLGEFTRDGMPRGLYRQALQTILPEPVLQRTSKGWFAPDYQKRIADCRPAILDFMTRHPAGAPVWRYLDRTKVETTLQRLDKPGSGIHWDNQFQLILCHQLRIAHFVTWMLPS